MAESPTAMQGVESSGADFKKPADPISIEKQQEELLKSKYKNMKPRTGSHLLQARIANKGTKYFDSGDYNMAKAKKLQAPGNKKISLEEKEVTGDHMPTPDEIPRGRKQSHSSRLALA